VACLFLALGCRKAEPGAERSPPSASAAAEAAVTAPSVAEEPSEAAAAPPEPPDAASNALPGITAEQLRASIRASGQKATLVNAWASWCGPCRRELPMLQALSANLKPQGVRIVLVSVDDVKDEPKAASYLKDSGITLTSYLVTGSIADFKAGINPSWPGMLPASFLFDRAGNLVHFWGGEAFENEIAPVVEDFLAGKSIKSETRFGLAPGKIE
jgi:cytochrome c biogenesis protein CcmG, thiol:disulfide interchange protein DsbE